MRKTNCMYLKSNMDRFIGKKRTLVKEADYNLKSNMDRFIDAKLLTTV